MTGDRAESVRTLERELGTLIRRLKRVVAERAHDIHPELQPAAYWMLTHLHQHGALRASAVVEGLELDKGAVSRHAQHLLDLGLVERTPDPEDGRATLLSLSDTAAARLAAVDADRRRWFDEALGAWDEAGLATFVTQLTRYNRTIEKARARRDGAGPSPTRP